MNLFAVVTGSPYSAQAVTETIQTLADGNRIHAQNTSSPVYSGRARKATARSRLRHPCSGTGRPGHHHGSSRRSELDAQSYNARGNADGTASGDALLLRQYRPRQREDRSVCSFIWDRTAVSQSSVLPGSPATGAGLQTNDVIVAVYETVRNGADMTGRINRLNRVRRYRSPSSVRANPPRSG